MARSIFLVVAAAISALGCDLQNHFIYFPDRTRPAEEALAAARLLFWPSPGDDYRGLIDNGASGKAAQGTVVVFHGNAGKAVDRSFYVEMLRPLGYRVILAEYPGYGGRTGALGEKSLVPDARRTLEIAYERYGGPIYVVGESLGCAVAAAAAGSASVPIRGVVLFTPWDTLKSLAAAKTSSLLAGLLKDRYDSVSNLRTFKGKVFIVGAARDEVVPIGHARSLYESLPGEKRMLTLESARHNDWPLHIRYEQIKEIMDFVSSN